MQIVTEQEDATNYIVLGVAGLQLCECKQVESFVN